MPVALITGASRGIGRGIALELAKLGRDLVINYAGNVGAARQTAADCLSAAQANGRMIRAEICQADISAGEDRRKLIEFTRSMFGRLDLLAAQLLATVTIGAGDERVRVRKVQARSAGRSA